MTEELMQRTVLVVDDTPENLALLNAVLGADYKVKVATSGERGLAIAQGEQPPDLILLDVMMPGMDGLETCRRLKAHDISRDIPVIFLSGKTDAEDEEEGLLAGALDYIQKPINPIMVLQRVQTQLRLAEAERALATLQVQHAVCLRDQAELGRAMDLFESVMAHDARSSLSVISGYSTLLRKKAEAAGEAQATQFLGSIRDGAKQVSVLVNHWRETARALRRPMAPQDVDVASLAQEVVHEVLMERHIEPEPQVRVESLPRAWCDPQALRLVLAHLVRNALLYARPGEAARVRVHARPSASEPVYCVDDQGIGFSAEDENRLFTPLQRLGEPPVGEGAGLGLFIARQAVLRNGGRMWAEGEPGVGARFRFSLPGTASSRSSARESE